MKLSRRVFFSALLFVRPSQQKTLEVAVLETFDMHGRTIAALAHHANPASRDDFAKWLQSNPRSSVRIRSGGREMSAAVFRVRMCFGRALIFPKDPVTIHEGDSLMISAVTSK